MARIFSTALVAALLSAGCHDWMVVPPLNDPTPGDIGKSPLTGLQLAATGILFQNRASYAGFISDVGIFGRESYNFFPTDGRTYSHYVEQNPLDPAGFASGGWNPRYTNLRNIKNFLAAVDAATALAPESKEAARGFAQTMEALELSYITAQRHDYGAVVQLTDEPSQLASFVPRDSVQNYIIARLDEARTHLLAAGTTAFPFKLHAGFTTNGTFNTPATFLQFNRAISARVQAWRAALGNPACGAAPGATCYSAALAALVEAGTDTTASLTRGVYHVFSTESGDALNGLNPSAGPNLFAHPSILTDAPADPLGKPDARYRAKIDTLAAQRCSVGGENVCTKLFFQVYGTTTSSAAIFRNEELILLQAEAFYFTGDATDALADINFIRRASGGLAIRGPFANAADFITELLLQRRYSLLWEGHRWVDVRRFGLMTTLPLDVPGQYRQVEQPVPQAECLQRVGLTGALACPPSVPVP